MSTFITVEEALSHILSRIPTTSPERVHLATGAGRYLAEPVTAPWNSPRFDNSAMDGFALRWEDIKAAPITLPITGHSSAGHPSAEVLAPGGAFRISTGAAIPSGADTVVPREYCDTKTLDDGTEAVTFKELPSRGQGANIRLQGTYLQAGDPALQPGQPLSGSDIGLLASFGRPVLQMCSRPRVAIISTGDELVELGVAPGPGQIINSNAYMLEALVTQCGGIPRVYPIAADRYQDILEVFEDAAHNADLIISSGGVSVGDHDHVRDVLEELSEGMTFWKVRMKPGKPLAFGAAKIAQRSVPILGLPGNPASSFVGFQLFARPAMAVAQGAAPGGVAPPRIEATLRGEVSGSRGRRAYIAGRVHAGDEGLVFEPRTHQSSGNPALFSGANALGIVEDDQHRIKAGSPIAVHLL